MGTWWCPRRRWVKRGWIVKYSRYIYIYMIYNDLLVDNSHRYANLVNQQRGDVPSSATSCFFDCLPWWTPLWSCGAPLPFDSASPFLGRKKADPEWCPTALGKDDGLSICTGWPSFFLFDPSIADGREIHTHTNLDKSYHYRLQSL